MSGALRVPYLSALCGHNGILPRECGIQEQHCKDRRNKAAGVSTGIGDHESKYTGKDPDGAKGDEQFEIDDNRSLYKMYSDIENEGLQPVLNDLQDDRLWIKLKC